MERPGDITRNLGDLEALLSSIDRQGYGAYKRIKGTWAGPGFTLIVDHVQADPFAAPSRVRIQIPQETHHIPIDLWSLPPRKVAVEDYLLRTFARVTREIHRGSGSGRSGEIHVDTGGAEILARTGCELSAATLELRFRRGSRPPGARYSARRRRTCCAGISRGPSRLCFGPTWTRMLSGAGQILPRTMPSCRKHWCTASSWRSCGMEHPAPSLGSFPAAAT